MLLIDVVAKKKMDGNIGMKLGASETKHRTWLKLMHMQRSYQQNSNISWPLGHKDKELEIGMA